MRDEINAVMYGITKGDVHPRRRSWIHHPPYSRESRYKGKSTVVFFHVREIIQCLDTRSEIKAT
jgi:hypothetical protein